MYQSLVQLRNVVSAGLPTYRHIIGLRSPESAKQSDYPFVFYAVSDELLDNSQQYKTQRCILLVGIENREYDKTNDVYKGVRDLINVTNTIKTLIKNNHTLNDSVINARVTKIMSDMGVRHPFYHAEIHVEVITHDHDQ